MKPSCVAAILAVAIVAVSAGSSALAQTSTPRLVVQSIDAPECVAPGQAFPLIVQVSDPVGIAGIEVRFGDEQVFIAGGGRSYQLFRHTLTMGAGPAGTVGGTGAAVVEVQAIGTDRLRGDVVRSRVSPGPCPDLRAISMDSVGLRAMVESWKRRALTPAASPSRGRQYQPAHVSANYWSDLFAPDSSRRFVSARDRWKLMGWWEAWRSAGGPQPFDWAAHCPGSPGITPQGEVLRCWLALHPEVMYAMEWATVSQSTGTVFVDPYAFWSPSMKAALDHSFYHAWQWLESGMTSLPLGPPDPPENQIPATAFGAATGLNEQQAQSLYLSTVAHSLALEIGGFVPWTVTQYSHDDLRLIFSSQTLVSAGDFQYSEGGVGKTFRGYVSIGATPQAAHRTWQFLVDQNIVRPTPYQSVAQLIQWARLVHVNDAEDDTAGMTNMQVAFMHWQYYGAPPVSRIISGTLRDNTTEPHHYSWGCSGNTAFLQSVLRALNIPTYVMYSTDLDQDPMNTFMHTMPLWPTIGTALGHGDHINGFIPDIQEDTFAPPEYVPPSMLFITLETFQDWFVTNPKETNVGRRIREIQMDVLPNEVMWRYCDDLAKGLPATEGSIYQMFSPYHSYRTMVQADHLWERLKQKNRALNWCATRY